MRLVICLPRCFCRREDRVPAGCKTFGSTYLCYCEPRPLRSIRLGIRLGMYCILLLDSDSTSGVREYLYVCQGRAILLSCVGEITASADHVRHHNRPIHSFPSRPSLRRLHLFAQIPVMEDASDSEENLYVSSCIIPFKMLELNLSPPDRALMSRMRLTTRS